ncbi:MAG: hypothetical protein IJR04_07805 [Bacteroidales bacterium]|nr:hypothetical protein [Bacteroidales bacterium]
MSEYHCSLKSGIACSDDIKKEKAPNKKRETAACGSACLRAAAPPLLFASPLALLSGGCAARPLPLLFLFSSLLRRLRRLTLPRALVGGWRRPPPLPSLFPLYQTINNPFRCSLQCIISSGARRHTNRHTS